MTYRLFTRISLGVLAGSLALCLAATNRADSTSAAPVEWKPVTPAQADGPIAFVTARLLESQHFNKQPFDAAVSGKFLDRYLKSLDPQRLHFLQSDLADFEKYRSSLHQMTIRRSGAADVSPGTEIFNRFFERLRQRVAYADEVLKNEKFEFDRDERILVNREDQPYPEDMEEARRLWRERLRYEYLQERLGKLSKTKEAPNAGSSEQTKPDPAVAEAPKKTIDEEITATLSHRYHRNERMFRDFTNEDVLQVYLSALAHVYDPHSDYLGREQLESFAIGMNLSLFGIGAELRMSEDGYCTINRLLPGGPAIKSGKLREKDRIVAVAQSNQPPVDVVDMNLTKAVQLIRGPKGTEVRLTIIPATGDSSSREVITLTRAEIPLEEQAAKARLIEVPGVGGSPQRLGVIDLPSFYASFDPTRTREKAEVKSTTADVRKLIEKLKKEDMAGLILDLRRNGGGSLEEAIRLTGLFIRKGPVVQVLDVRGAREVESDNDPDVAYDGPLVVLTSKFSASASEIVAGALQDYGRALIVGEVSTHGKGTVQSVNPLQPYLSFSRITTDPGALKLTIKKFYRASGASTQLRGVTPDIVLPSLFNESKEFGESSLDNPLPWDTIESAKYEYLNRVEPYLAELQRLSGERVAADQDFAYVKEDIATYKKQREEKTISLNEPARLREKEELEARQKARNKERLARKEPDQKVYEITLKLVDQPGLPAPLEKTNTVARVGGGAAMAHPIELAASETEGDPESEKAPAVDPVMGEAQRILLDYLALASKQNVAWAAKSVVNAQ